MSQDESTQQQQVQPQSPSWGEAELEKLKSCHDEAYLYVSQALSYEESNENTLALRMYEQGVAKLQEGLTIRCDRPFCTGRRWDDARKMHFKMQKTLHESQGRISHLRSLLNLPRTTRSQSMTNAVAPPVDTGVDRCSSFPPTPSIYPDATPPDRPPTYDEALLHQKCDDKWSASGQKLKLQAENSVPDGIIPNGNPPNTSVSQPENPSSPTSEEAELIFTIPEGVQMFFVTPDGYVSAPSYPSALHIYRFLNTRQRASHLPQAWLQIDTWTYPLHRDSSPVLHTKYGAYMFPDLTAQVPGCSVGVILPSHAAQYVETFEILLAEYTQYRTEEPSQLFIDAAAKAAERDRLSYKISQGLITGAEALSFGLTKGAEFTGMLIHKGANLLKERIQPEATPYKVDPRLKAGVTIVQNTSTVVCKVSGYLVNKLGEGTKILAKHVGPHIRHHTSKALANVFHTDEVDSSRKVDDLFQVAAGGLTGLSTLYMGLEEAARTLAYSLSQETVQVVQHKYGSEASEVAGTALSSIGNLALAGNNVKNLGIKSIAKRTAKDTGKVVLEEYIEQVTAREASFGEKPSEKGDCEKKKP